MFGKKKKDVVVDPAVLIKQKEDELAKLKADVPEVLASDEVSVESKDVPKVSKQESNPLIDYLNGLGNAAASLEVERFKLLLDIQARLVRIEELLSKK